MSSNKTNAPADFSVGAFVLCRAITAQAQPSPRIAKNSSHEFLRRRKPPPLPTARLERDYSAVIEYKRIPRLLVVAGNAPK